MLLCFCYNRRFSVFLQELQTLISRYRQNILTVKTSAEHMEDKLRSEIMFLKDRVKAEQVAKDNIEETLSSDLDVARDEMGEENTVMRH